MKSPLKAKPLRNPGQSLDRYIADVALDHGVKYVMLGGAIWLVLGFRWDKKMEIIISGVHKING